MHGRARENPGFEVEETKDGIVLSLTGALDTHSYPGLKKDLERLVARRCPARLEIRLEKVSRMDDHGVLLLLGLHQKMRRRGGECHVEGAAGPVAEALRMLRFEEICAAGPLKKRRLPNPVVALGEEAIRHALAMREMFVFTGAVLLGLLKVCVSPFSLRWEDTVYSMRRVGVDALPIVALISFLLGFIIAFMSSAQLRQFGANSYVAYLVALAIVRELGPIMTAIVVAGRSGSAFASEIGTMKINEELNALTTMGFDPVYFLVVPKTVASLAVVPLLTLFACLFGIVGGLVVGVFILDLTYSQYVKQTLEVLTLPDLAWSCGKSVVFAFIVAWTGCLRGFEVKGGALAVGGATTSAVVTSIFLIIVIDSLFAVVQLYYGAFALT
jgi:phospholipid/cholesterol/gamma-HCH transport system permease protein